MSKSEDWNVYNPSGKDQILVSKMLPGKEWLEIFLNMDYRVEVNLKQETNKLELLKKIGNNCKAVIGQLTEEWDVELFKKLSAAGGKGYCNYAEGLLVAWFGGIHQSHYDVCIYQSARKEGITPSLTPPRKGISYQ